MHRTILLVSILLSQRCRILLRSTRNPRKKIDDEKANRLPVVKPRSARRPNNAYFPSGTVSRRCLSLAEWPRDAESCRVRTAWARMLLS